MMRAHVTEPEIRIILVLLGVVQEAVREVSTSIRVLVHVNLAQLWESARKALSFRCDTVQDQEQKTILVNHVANRVMGVWKVTTLMSMAVQVTLLLMIHVNRVCRKVTANMDSTTTLLNVRVEQLKISHVLIVRQVKQNAQKIVTSTIRLNVTVKEPKTVV